MRPSWNTYFLEVAKLVATRSTCPRLHVGCVLVRNNRIIATGYNGSKPGEDHCEDIGCKMVDNHCVRTIHAEDNATRELQKNNRLFVAYVTHTPCFYCEAKLRLAGASRIVVAEEYPKKEPAD